MHIYALVYHYICVLENITSLLASEAPILPLAMVRTDRVSEHLPISEISPREAPKYSPEFFEPETTDADNKRGCSVAILTYTSPCWDFN